MQAAPGSCSTLQLCRSGDLDAVGDLAAGREGGTCWATLATGLAALSFPTYEEGVGWAISHGFDTDTNAAVAGALLGCREGVQGITDRWLSRLQDRQRLEAAAAALTGSAD